MNAFHRAATEGDFNAILAVLDPEVVLCADGPLLGGRVVQGAKSVAEQASALAQLPLAANPVLVNGAAGLVVTSAGRLYSVMAFTVSGGRIIEIDVLADPRRPEKLDLAVTFPHGLPSSGTGREPAQPAVQQRIEGVDAGLVDNGSLRSTTL